MSNDKVKEIVVARLLEAMENGVCPWRKTWTTSGIRPSNYVGRKYSGINYFILSMLPFAVPVFLTFNQAAKLGGTVRKGEKGIPVSFWKMLKKVEDGVEKVIPMMRYYTVFNISQCDGIELPKRFKVEQPANPFTPIERAEAIWNGMENKPTLRIGGDRACFIPSMDEIHMPTPESFSIPEEYYSTLFHEATHSTGHSSRLDRKEVMNPITFGSHDYSLEELVAEMGAAIMCADAGIDQPTLENSAAYLRSWHSKLSKDPGMLITAASRACKAADYIIGKAEEDLEEGEDTAVA